MAKKSALFGGRVVKVENRSSFDKSRLNLLTTGVGTITPIMKQLVIPSSGRCKVSLHAELPPLAADTYLRTHLKLEAFFVPLRICSGSVESWYSGEPVWDEDSNNYTRAKLPRGFIINEFDDGETPPLSDYPNSTEFNQVFGAGTLTDFFDVRLPLDATTKEAYLPSAANDGKVHQSDHFSYYGRPVNIFPYVCYHLIYDHFYRNKSVQRPAFVKPSLTDNGLPAKRDNASHLPYLTDKYILDVILGSDIEVRNGEFPSINYVGDIVGSPYLANCTTDYLLNGYHLWELRQRNYGDDYFTAAKPSAQAGSASTVDTSGGSFTISALRASNAWQEFQENQGYANPDYIQTNVARYGVKLSDGIAQKPVLLASADFPMFTKSIEQNAPLSGETYSGVSQRNPFTASGFLGASAGKASANAQGFSFDFDVHEPGYIMVMATLVPEANYAQGFAKDMEIFTQDGSLTDLPVGLLEHIGDEPIMSSELNATSAVSSVFGFVQRYLWHKAGQNNSVHGKFRKFMDLQAFAPQRNIDEDSQISDSFLEIPKTALDDVAAVSQGISGYGVMMDCAIELFVSEPLTESALPALVNPASEHGKSIYLNTGGSKLS